MGKVSHHTHTQRKKEGEEEREGEGEGESVQSARLSSTRLLSQVLTSSTFLFPSVDLDLTGFNERGSTYKAF